MKLLMSLNMFLKVAIQAKILYNYSLDQCYVLFDGTVVETKSFVPFVSDMEEFDTDKDGLFDNEETECAGTDVRKADTDEDGLSDGEEVELWYDPLNANPDNDSFNDKEEYDDNTSPFVYDYTVAESSLQVIKGGLLGDFDIPDTIPGLIGQISASFVPIAADVRDYFANVFVNQDSKAAIWNIFGWSMDLIPIAGASVDGAKVIPKVSKFVSKFSKDAAKVLDAITNVSRRLPGFNKFMPELAHAIPTGSYDNIAKSIAEGSSKVTKSDYKYLETIMEAAGKNADDVLAQAHKGAKLPTGEAQLKHIFRNDVGHLIDTPANRQLIESVADDATAFAGFDSKGMAWFSKIQDDGSQI